MKAIAAGLAAVLGLGGCATTPVFMIAIDEAQRHISGDVVVMDAREDQNVVMTNLGGDRTTTTSFFALDPSLNGALKVFIEDAGGRAPMSVTIQELTIKNRVSLFNSDLSCVLRTRVMPGSHDVRTLSLIPEGPTIWVRDIGRLIITKCLQEHAAAVVARAKKPAI